MLPVWLVLEDPTPLATETAPDEGEPTPEATTEEPAPETSDEPTTKPSDEESTEPEPTTTPAPEESTPESPPTDEASTPVVVPTAEVPVVRPPAVVTSTVPTGLVVIALVVLVLAAALFAVLVRRAGGRSARPAVAGTGVATGSLPTVPIPVADAGTTVGSEPGTWPTTIVAPPGSAPTIAVPPPDEGRGRVPTPRTTDEEESVEEHAALVVRLLMTLGEAMIDASAPVADVRQALDRVAAVQGLPATEVVALPTALLVSVPGTRAAHTAAASAGGRSLRLDQVQGVLEVAELAGSGELAPAAALARLADVLDAPPPYRRSARVAGYVAIAAGLALILGGGWPDVLVAAVLGAGISALRRRFYASNDIEALVVLAGSFVVSVVVFLLVRAGVDLVPLASLVPPLVTFLPGALLTTAAIDLATRQMIAGSARVASGVMQLVLLAVGITVGAGLVGMPTDLLGPAGETPLGVAAPWLGVLVFGVGAIYQHGVRPDARVWVFLVLVVAYAGQVLGGLVLGGAVSAFVGALAMTVVAMAVAVRGGPPALVTFLPGFWLLVPGALGLVGVTSVLGDETLQALGTLITTATTMVSISLGVLAGTVLAGAALRRHARP